MFNPFTRPIASLFLLLIGLYSPLLLAQDGCGLSVNKQCQVILPEAGDFSCSDAKPIDSLTMVWEGQDGVTVKAWKGSVGGMLLREVSGVGQGDALTVSGMAGSPNDQVWEIFAASGVKLGESKFHISCSDDNMDGPEDCGLPAGDGKSDEAGLLNTWAFEGMSGSGSTLDCTPEPPPPAENCTLEKRARPSCDSIGKPVSLAFVYSGGDCDPAGNDQGSKTACMETGPLDGPVTVTSSSSDLTIVPGTVELGQEFTISGDFSSATVLALVTANGSQELNIHTSCSAPLAVGDVFGGLTLAEFNGQRLGTLVNYLYTVSNTGVDLTGVLVEDNLLGVVGGPLELASGAEAAFAASAVITDTTVNRVDVTGETAGGTICLADDSTTVTLTEACDTCKGGTTELVLRYLGSSAALVTVYDDSGPKDDKILFDAVVDPFEDLPLVKQPGKDKLNGDISIYVDDIFHAKLHTSCSKPIGADLKIGDFEIVEGRSKDNGLMCALDVCNVATADLKFHDREVRLIIENQGEANVAIDRVSIDWPDFNGNLREIKRDGDTIIKGDYLPGNAEIDSGWEGDLDKRTVKAGETDTLKFKFDYDVDRFADYSLSVDFDQGCGVTRAFTAAPSACAECEGGTVELTFVYLGGEVADVVVYDASSVNNDKILFAGSVAPGDLVPVSRRLGQDKLSSDISIYVNGLLHRKLHTSCSDPIGPELIVGDFRIETARSRYNGPVCPLNVCDVEGQFLDIDGNKVTYPITNLGDVDVVIKRLSVGWPAQTGYLKKVKNDGSTLQDGLFTPPFAEFLSVWEGNAGDRTVDSGDTSPVEFEFASDASFAGSYQVNVEFDQGCSTSRTFFGPGDCGFACEKPITALGMRWEGSKTVDVVVWDGPVGSTLVRTISNVTPGRQIFVSGISGSVNDIYWEIFDSVTGAKLGESKFHLSCSDEDMNGPEDFRKPAGNGKDNSPAFINSWAFYDMIAAGRLLRCPD